MNRTLHSLVAFLALIAAIVILGLASGVISYLGCGSTGETSALGSAMAALTALAGVFRPSSTPQTDGGSNAPAALPQAP